MQIGREKVKPKGSLQNLWIRVHTMMLTSASLFGCDRNAKENFRGEQKI